MRYLAIVVLLAAACVPRVRVTHVDYDTHQCTICGNKWAAASDLDAAAAQACRDGHARTMQCGEHVYASATHSTAYANGSGLAVSRGIAGLCCQYQCETATASQP